MTARAPYVNADERRKRLANSALVAVFMEELIRHGSDDLPKFRRGREIARQLRHLRQSMRRDVSRARALFPGS